MVNLSKKILVVDDDDALLEIMQEAFNYLGFDVKTVHNPSEIFIDIKNYNPDLILIDYLLENANGGEVCHAIKAQTDTADIPVILMSSYSKTFLSLGLYNCDDFIAKPFDMYDLLKRVQNCLHAKDLSKNASTE
ncbi:MAG: hypothetical protein JWQ25_1865 [Daejeonella sp.]|nr:hypothetical protein [Daejeonella sp.]